jgi:hypothetical protein
VRLASILVLVAALASACTTESGSMTTASPTHPAASPAPALPPGLPPSFADDVGPGDVPAAALVPLTAEVTGSWDAATSAGDAIVVAWAMPGPDPFRLDRGIAAWRRFDDGGAPWRPVWGAAYPARRDALQNLTADVADVTGDGSADAIVTAEIGGSGACGTVSVVELTSGSRVYRSAGCDRIVTASTDPVGLTIREAVYRPGDAHCCPSAVRTTVLADVDGEWTTVRSTTSPA